VYAVEQRAEFYTLTGRIARATFNEVEVAATGYDLATSQQVRGEASGPVGAKPQRDAIGNAAEAHGRRTRRVFSDGASTVSPQKKHAFSHL